MKHNSNGPSQFKPKISNIYNQKINIFYSAHKTQQEYQYMLNKMKNYIFTTVHAIDNNL